jgi:hypothetical protein
MQATRARRRKTASDENSPKQDRRNATFSMRLRWHRACLTVSVTTQSKVISLRQSKRLRNLYQRRDHIVQVIESLEQIQRLRSRRSEAALQQVLLVREKLAA